MVRFLIFLLFFIVFSNGWSQTNNPSIDARLSQSTITFGQSVTLEITARNGANLDALDFSILEQDFNVGGISRQQYTQIINGQVRNESSLIIPLRPKRTGTLTIPSFTVGNVSTATLTLTVEAQTPSNNTTASGNGDYWLEMTLPEKKDYYVQEHIPLTVRLFTRIPMQNVEITPPLLDTTVAHKISNDRLYNQTVDQKNYQVLEQKFILIPERSGKLSLPAASFQALDLRQNTPSARNYDPFMNDPFFNDPFFSALRLPSFNSSTPISGVSNTLEINILPIPADQDAATWLPAEKINMRWQNPPPTTMTVGEPVTLTLEIRAEGASSAQLPEIALPEVSGLRFYPGKITNEDQSDGQKIIGVRSITFTLIGQRPGEFILPSIGLNYWQVRDQKSQRVEIPVSGIRMLANPALTNNLENQAVKSEKAFGFWWGMITSLLLVVVIAALFFLWWWRKNQAITPQIVTRVEAKNQVQQKETAKAATTATTTLKQESKKTISENEKNHANNLNNKAINQAAWRECLTACARNDAKTAAQTLLTATGFSSLLDLAEALAEPCPALLTLHQALYQAQPWQGEALAACLRKGLKFAEKTENNDSLPPFYPE